MNSRITFFLNRLDERLWVRPLLFCILSIGGAFIAKLADRAELGAFVPEITPDSIESLLSIVAASMLVIATFSVASMVSAYASASSSGTPRSFPLIVSDDVSQNALSVFIGAFIFSIVALVALKNGYYGKAGHFALFVLTLFVFAWVVLTFVRWVDKIARLGRLGNTIEKVEKAAKVALELRRRNPHLGGIPVQDACDKGEAVCATRIGHVQHIDMAALQDYAEKHSLRITVAALPGAFMTADRTLCYCASTESGGLPADYEQTRTAFQVGDSRVYEDDPRFGLVVLSEIASRALSPAVNDPGTAIAVVGTLLRLFSLWSTLDAKPGAEPRFDRVAVPTLAMPDLFDDAFTSIARDGAGAIEVQLRLQKAFRALAVAGDGDIADAARRHSRAALARAEHAMTLRDDYETLRVAAEWSST